MTPQFAHRNTIDMLSEIRYAFHPWQNLSIIGNDGVLFHIDPIAIDVDDDGRGGGIAHLKRMRLLPITTTQTPVINNKDGFSVSNVFVGSAGAGETVNLSSLQHHTKTNVRADWSYPAQKLQDMNYTFGKYGLIGINAFAAKDQKEVRRHQMLFRLLMSGTDDRTLLEDLPEYFGSISPYLLDKRPANFPRGTAAKIIETAAAAGKDGFEFGDEQIAVSPKEIEQLQILHDELATSILSAHTAALDAGSGGILAATRDAIQKGEKRGIDKADQWLMSQFPSFPMDTQLEKSNKQLLKALESPEPAPSGYVPAEAFEAEKRRNDALEQRLAQIEANMTANAEAK